MYIAYSDTYSRWGWTRPGRLLFLTFAVCVCISTYIHSFAFVRCGLVVSFSRWSCFAGIYICICDVITKVVIFFETHGILYTIHIYDVNFSVPRVLVLIWFINCSRKNGGPALQYIYYYSCFAMCSHKSRSDMCAAPEKCVYIYISLTIRKKNHHIYTDSHCAWVSELYSHIRQSLGS